MGDDDMPTDTAVAYMLTTVDNPWNPFVNWDEWYAYDRDKGYDTPGYLARVCKFSFELSDADQEQAIMDAINEIVEMNPLGIYRKISNTD
jgi:hypothetical protein